jgi:hypothetical protein
MTSSRIYTQGVMNRFVVDEVNAFDFPEEIERYGVDAAGNLRVDVAALPHRVQLYLGQVAVSVSEAGGTVPDSVLRWAIRSAEGGVDLAAPGGGFGEGLVYAAPDPAAVERGLTVLLTVASVTSAGRPSLPVPLAEALDLGELYVDLAMATADPVAPGGGTLTPDALTQAAPAAFPSVTRLRARRQAIDDLAGDVHPAAQYPLSPEIEAARQAAIDGLQQAGIPVTSAVDTKVWVDGAGATRVDLSVPLGADNAVLPPITGRAIGDPAATSIVKVDVTIPTDGGLPYTHVRVIDVSDNRIRYANTEAGGGFVASDVTGAVTAATARAAGPLLADGRLRQPWIGDRSAIIRDDGTVRTTPRPAPVAASPPARKVPRALIGAGVVVAVGLISLAVALAGGGDDADPVDIGSGEEVGVDDTTPADDAVDETAVGAAATDPADLAAAVPPGDMAWVAHLTQVIAPPPAPIQPLTVGHEFRGTLAIEESCTGSACTYTTVFDLGVAPHPVGEVPAIAWVQDGANWHLDSYANVLSASYGAGLDCVYLRKQTWDLTSTEATWDGERWMVAAWEGTLLIDTQMNAELSQGAIARKLCPGYQDVSAWDATAAPAP